MSRVYKKGVQHLYVAGSLHDDIRRQQYIVPFCLIDFRMSRAFALLYILPLIYIYCVRVVVHSRTLTHTHTHIYVFYQLYNSLWVLACSIISFHCFHSCVLCFQLVTPIFLKSFLTSSSHLTLGLPFGLVAYGFHLYIAVRYVKYSWH